MRLPSHDRCGLLLAKAERSRGRRTTKRNVRECFASARHENTIFTAHDEVRQQKQRRTSKQRDECEISPIDRQKQEVRQSLTGPCSARPLARQFRPRSAFPVSLSWNVSWKAVHSRLCAYCLFDVVIRTLHESSTASSRSESIDCSSKEELAT
jgi:hypothetical protein